MTFPDQSHINRVRDALWKRTGNGASVMVGSGFSRNSEQIIRNASKMPTWEDLVNHFYEALYPLVSTSSHRMGDRPSTDNVRVAQEYEAAFGRSALHDALRQLVPDTEHVPSLMHRRLLKLPWRDVYTTNWDTLLERAQDQVTEQHYSTVTSVDEIPMAGRPRIVKLHGSLPAQFPLIVTEEDYRTYPAKFAPFVNTVQQSMMETVFLLIGFSGDDPNFLNWSGWVRDNLGPSAPKIYLAGWLALSPHRRRMLESHSVVPIDLAQHPRAGEWSENLRHEYAAEWLIRTLELGCPYDITSWPYISGSTVDEISSNPLLLPLEAASTAEPKPEGTRIGDQPEHTPEDVREITDIWRHNRLMYPGWLTMPPFHRRSMTQNTYTWGSQALEALPTMTPVERLGVLRELVWRMETLLIPIQRDLQSTTQGVLDAVDCQNRTIDGVPAANEDWPSIRENWRNIAVALLTTTRFQFDRDGFNQAAKALEPFQDEDPDLRHRVFHEKCLLDIYDRDFTSLEDLLEDWNTQNCDPAWMIRKSAVLWEARRNSEASELLNDALTAIKAMPPSEDGFAALSRESWATFVALDFHNRLALLDRLRQLVPMRCDPFAERQSVTDGMGQDKAEETPPPFDINRNPGTSERWVNYEPLTEAYRAVRLSEIAGLPPRTGHSNVWAEVLKKAAEEVADYDLELAVRLVLRACDDENDKTLQRILTRTRVATMPTDLAETLTRCCLNTLDKVTSDGVSRASASQQRFNTAAEVLSRLVIRIEQGSVEPILDRALGYCENVELAKSFVDRTIENLLSRSWTALPAQRRQQRAMDMLNTSMVGLSNLNPIMEDRWPDPANMVAPNELLRIPETESQWHTAIDSVVRGLNSNATTRRNATGRMIRLVRSGNLSEDETQLIATALWSEQHTPTDGLPKNTTLYDWAFLAFPEPTSDLAERSFHSKWISPNEDESHEIQRKNRGLKKTADAPNGVNHDHQDIDSRLWQTGSAIRSLQSTGQNLTLSQADREHLAGLLESWANDPVPEQNDIGWSDIFEDSIHELTLQVVNALSPIMGEITVSRSLGDKIFKKMQDLTAGHLPAFALAEGLISTNPDRTTEVATALRIGITSDDSQLITNAFSVMHRWLETASEPDSKVPHPPDDLVREVGIAIASRRNTAVTAALQVAAWIFNRGQDSHKEAIKGLAEHGLHYLAQELRYDRAHENPDEIPRKRLYCAELATAMAKSGLEEIISVALWLDIAREDPLPEVRQVVETSSTQ